MRLRNIVAILGKLYLVLGLFQMIPLAISLQKADGASSSFLMTILIAVGLGLLMQIHRPGIVNIQRWEAIVTVVFGWLGASVIGALPFYFSGQMGGWTECLFESVSGFTTTGASIIDNVEALPASLLVWRTLTHWIGGMGIIILALVVLPAINTSGRSLYIFESSSIANEQITPKIKDTARLLWTVYFILTASLTCLLLICGLDFFNAALTAMATIATGGFSPKNASIAAYNSVWVEMIVVVFMILSGVNFTLYLKLFKPSLSFRAYAEVLFIYLGIFLGAAAIVVIDLRLHTYSSWLAALRYGVFQVASINTTTGFVTADWDTWYPLTHFILLLLMLIGACPGSTCGAIKNSRIILLVKAIRREMVQLIHPRVVTSVQLNNRTIDEKTILNAIIYIGLYIGFFLLASLVLSLGRLPMETALFSVASTLGGVGPGVGIVGPIESYAALSAGHKYLLMACMLFGRLEFYTIFIVFVPRFWRRG